MHELASNLYLQASTDAANDPIGVRREAIKSFSELSKVH
jgi:hypothetical protein